ncbi:bifunctional pyr operon transcriptional regulator/uracil phosphoribosyltransferase PyrR [Desulfopila aestuarii]|uniref:Bifunctional protein PyrR n=1 Tax=Desulfopila aestuarii DSM 18488 TaxID=1121416 RepID=A0A1M7YG81_9BACT|nr:bifunctional pyr operon transcriptional regulator/uracil phosphoribosyltransferase PyrR [Desulfopila aestuarii]SHO51642.1 pyrimidine operon attenuation protein / uracil phosphoribosyltransferase [Desulfopila aestuarii DSM 18488]
MSEQKRTIMTSQDIDLALKRVGLQILERNQGAKSLAIVGIHTCGVFLAKRLCRILEEQGGRQVEYGSLDINLYRDDWSLISQNPVVKTTDISFDVNNTNLVLVDDVVFTGRTIRAAMEAIMDYGRPHTIQLAALVDRGGRELPIQPDYVGMQATILPKERIQVLLEENADCNEVVVEC